MRISLVAILMVSAILAENILDVEALDEAKTMEGLDQGLNETLFGEEALDEIRTAEYLVKSLKDQQAYFDSKLDWNSSDVYSRDADPATTVEAMVEVADKPTDVIQKTKDISANISTVRSGGTSCDVNGWDGNQYCLCPNGQRISIFESHHHNHHEDRRWYLKCAVGPEYPIENKRYWYTAQRANAYDGILRWDGTSTNSFLVGMKSHHNNHHEDRQYTLFTATAKNWNLYQCSGWKQLNSYDHGIKYVLATNEVIAAVYSHHSDHREDREFAIKVCFLLQGPSPPPLKAVSAKMSSTYSGDFPADRCIDGRKDGSRTGSMCHTRGEKAPWLALDFGLPVSVEKIVINNREDCCGDRFRNVEVRVADQLPNSGHQKFTGGHLLASFKGPAKNGDAITLPSGTKFAGRFVIVQIDNGQRTIILNLNEVTVWGKKGQNPWHSNGRCGSQNPLTDGRPGQCDPTGNKNEVGPCCSNIGWCGNSDAHCKCQGCKGPCATFFEHSKCTGKSFAIQEGKTPYSMFRDNGFNDAASSIRVKSGCRVQYYEHDISGGKTGTATQDTSYVGNDWNDKISSASCAC